MSETTTKKSRITTADRLDSGIVRLCQVAEGLAQLLEKQQTRDRDVPEKAGCLQAPGDYEAQQTKSIYGYVDDQMRELARRLYDAEQRIATLERDRDDLVDRYIQRRLDRGKNGGSMTEDAKPANPLLRHGMTGSIGRY